MAEYPEAMQLVLDDAELHAPIVLHPPAMDDDEYFAFCQRYPDFRIERTARGEIVIMPPTGVETAYRNNDLARQLGNWAKADKRGVALDSNAEFILPNGAALSPDASWVLKSRLDRFTKKQRQKLLPISPDFVVELTSSSDRLKQVKAKMREWIENGVQLGWLLDADRKTAYIYRPAREPEELVGPGELNGEGPVAGFVLHLKDIWAGL
jgi:Uma2 family endonuclease